MFRFIPKQFTCLLLLLLSYCLSLRAQTATDLDDPEIRSIFIADQADRGNNPFAKPGDPQPHGVTSAQMYINDGIRDDQVKALVDAGRLHTANDYFRAALVFQHASHPDGQLYAHVLAMIAISKGSGSALWLSAATLDRYLVATGKPQMFGTQFSAKQPAAGQSSVFSQDTVSQLLSDALRADLCVKPLAEQSKGLSANISTSLTPCPAGATLRQHFTPAASSPAVGPAPMKQ